MKLSEYRYGESPMKVAAVCLAISLAAGGSAFAAERAAPTAKQCEAIDALIIAHKGEVFIPLTQKQWQISIACRKPVYVPSHSALEGLSLVAERAHQHPKVDNAPKQEAVAKCVTPLGDFLHSIGDESKDLATSKPLTDKQYAFISEEVKKHAPLKKIAGDGAIVIHTDGEFAVLFTKGADADAMICAFMPVPEEIVAGIIAIDAPAKTPPSGTDHAAPKEEPWL
jgi:hypothetical protein